MTMRERIARGIHASLSGVESVEADTAWDGMSEADRAPYRTAAIRLLTIIRTPTDAMLREGNRPGGPSDASNVWERMAFAALYDEN